MCFIACQDSCAIVPGLGFGCRKINVWFRSQTWTVRASLLAIPSSSAGLHGGYFFRDFAKSGVISTWMKYPENTGNSTIVNLAFVFFFFFAKNHRETKNVIGTVVIAMATLSTSHAVAFFMG